MILGIQPSQLIICVISDKNSKWENFFFKTPIRLFWYRQPKYNRAPRSSCCLRLLPIIIIDSERCHLSIALCSLPVRGVVFLSPSVALPSRFTPVGVSYFSMQPVHPVLCLPCARLSVAVRVCRLFLEACVLPLKGGWICPNQFSIFCSDGVTGIIMGTDNRNNPWRVSESGFRSLSS